MTCPHCQQAADFHGYRSKKPLSLLGPLRLTRAYYYCGRCDGGLFPWDEAVGLTAKRLTPAAEEVAALAGTLAEGFQEAAQEVLPRLAGLQLGESTVERTTEDAGRRARAFFAAGHTLGARRPWTWQRDACGRTCAYVAIDAIAVAQQGAKGCAAPGRMPYVAMVYNPVPERPAGTDGAAAPPGAPARMQARYLAGLYELGALGVALRRQAAHVGMEAAAVWIGLSDGGNGLEEFVQNNFNRPDLILILDFWHAAEDLGELARLLHRGDEEAAAAQAAAWCHTLKHRGVAVILEELEALALPRRPEVKQKHTDVLRYFRKNAHRMDYPYYRAQGWQIGSGPVESGCKTVVGQRLKLAGMRWGEDGTDTVCHLRARASRVSGMPSGSAA